MATVNFIGYKYQSASVMKRVGGYVIQSHKTDGQNLVSGQNCCPQLAVQEFIATRNAHRKDSPVWFYHYTQSFHPDEPITGQQAHAIAKEFAAKAWPDSEVLIATHVDAEHIHSHFIVNAVCHESGRMLRQGPDTLFGLRPISDELCMKYGFSVLKKAPRRSNGMSSREYRAAAKGQSWKFRLMNTIDECMRYSASCDEFIALMRSEGYEVKWTGSRKNITYILQNGRKCNDDKLHDNKYLKEVMEHEFRIRQEIISGGTETVTYASGTAADSRTHTHTYTDAGAGAAHGNPVYAAERDGAAGASAEEHRGDSGTPDRVPASALGAHGGSHTDADGGTAESGEASGGDGRTGWEAEREAYFTQQTQTAQDQPSQLGRSRGGDSGRDLAGSVTSVVAAVRRLEQNLDAPVMDATTHRYHVDSKTLKKLKQKKIALGHKADDHEDEQTWQQTM